ncbi:isochorismate synthase [Ectobacillus ponti]|uniref:isochorismate synthase n=1 Tax=Ectobacillus ponti TaxID=2961894 RepID=A0AA42BRP8_9BACI|nr:isochorismate synthase [Ectobacillus ponti]MCP8967588.1 isochorismate synthase [Ectobacillus ponti]
MIRTEHQGLLQSLLAAVQRATHDQPVLVSAVTKVDWIDPLLFYAAGRRLGYQERLYWSDPEQRIVFAGIGSVFTIASDLQKRFPYAQETWQRLLDNVIVNGPASLFGTGPLLFGGFSFDPLREKTELWSAFADTVLVLPAMLLTMKEGESWLTINRFVRAGEDATHIYKEMTQLEEQALAFGNGTLSEACSAVEQVREVQPAAWMDSIHRVKEEIRKGHVQKVVLARELQLTMEHEPDTVAVLQAMRIGQPDCYIFAFDYNGACFLGATPERLVKKEGNKFTSMCLAGSIGRGKTPEEDERNAAALLADEKNLVEHAYVVEMIRDVLERLCEAVNIPQTPGVMRNKNLIHLHTPVEAEGDCSLLTMVELLHPTPALGGTPREEALRLIRENEQLDRGFYAGPIGWIDYEGNGEFAVGIRSALVSGEQASLFAGCGIVEDSDPLLEYEETKMKFKPMLSALGGYKK